MDRFKVNNCSFNWTKDSILSEQDKLQIKKELSSIEQEIQETLEFTKKIYNLNNRTIVARLWLESDTTTECILTTYNDKGKDSWFMIIETVEMKVLCGISCKKPKISYQTISNI